MPDVFLDEDIETAIPILRALYREGVAFTMLKTFNIPLVFTRLWLSPTTMLEFPKATPKGVTLGMQQDGTYVVVSWIGRGAYPFQLLHKHPYNAEEWPSGYVDPQYFGSKFGGEYTEEKNRVAALLNGIIKAQELYVFARAEDDGRVVALNRGGSAWGTIPLSRPDGAPDVFFREFTAYPVINEVMQRLAK